MTTRSSTLAASALLLVAGCSGPSTTTDIEAHRPGPSAAPAVAAAGPRVPSAQVVFAPEIPAALRAPVPAARTRGLVFSVGSGDPADEGELPPVPVPEGWVPSAGPTSREVLGLDAAEFVEGADPADEPVFAEEPMAEEPMAEEAVFEDAGYDESTWDEDSEVIVIDEIRYVETVEYETETIEIGTPVLVVQGYSSWGYGTYPVVRSSRRFDPCFTPPGGACWAPVDFDPCWNACTDPAWGTWNMVGEERNRRGHGGNIGLEVGGNRDNPAPPKAPKPRRDPPAPPPSPSARVARSAPPARPEPAVLEIPASPAPAPRRAPVARLSREIPAYRPRGSEGADAPAAPPAPRTSTGGRRTTAAEPAATPRVERPVVRRTGRDEEPQAAAAPAPTPRVERQRGRDRAEPRDEPRAEPQAAPAREPRRVEVPRPEPVREPAHGRSGGRGESTPEVQAPPPPPPAPERHGGGGKRGK